MSREDRVEGAERQAVEGTNVVGDPTWPLPARRRPSPVWLPGIRVFRKSCRFGGKAGPKYAASPTWPPAARRRPKPGNSKPHESPHRFEFVFDLDFSMIPGSHAGSQEKRAPSGRRRPTATRHSRTVLINCDRGRAILVAERPYNGSRGFQPTGLSASPGSRRVATLEMLVYVLAVFSCVAYATPD